MLAAILILGMILLHTSALLFALLAGRRLIGAAASLSRKSAHSKMHNRERPDGAGFENRRVICTFDC